ncbi:hypothetical protein ABFX02_10G106000 [Erythranthe guttata]
MYFKQYFLLCFFYNTLMYIYGCILLLELSILVPYLFCTFSNSTLISLFSNCALSLHLSLRQSPPTAYGGAPPCCAGSSKPLGAFPGTPPPISVDANQQRCRGNHHRLEGSAI